MRSVFFCEGKTDVALVRKFVEGLGDGFSCELFHGEECEYSELNRRESEAIRNFIQSYHYHPFDALVKSENGKPNLQTNFAHFCKSLVERDVRFHLVIDLDYGTLDGVLRELGECIDGRHTQPPEFGSRNVLDRNDDLVVARSELVVGDGARVDEFGIVAFDPDLEEVAGISDADDGDEIDRKLDHLLAHDHVFEALQAVVQ